MADEVSQVVEFECKGCVYLLKGSKDAIAFMGKMLMAIKDWGHERRMNIQGESSWQKIQEVSEGTPVIMNFPKDMFEKTMRDPRNSDEFISPFELYCRENKLRYCTMPDLNPDDEYIPIAVPCQDAGIHSQQIEQYMKRKIVREEAKDEEYAKKIEEAKAIIAKADKDKEEAEELLRMLETGKGENAEILKKSKEQMEKGNVIDFNEYLMMGKGTIFDLDPEHAANIAEVGGFVREYMPEDCMYPVRDEALVPDTREIFYSQMADDDTMLTVRRSFYQDENGIVYSQYKVNNPAAPESVRIFSDKGIDIEVWKKQLPALLKEAGMKAEKPAIAIHGLKRFQNYVAGFDENFTRAGKEAGRDEEVSNEEEFSSEETREFVESTERDNMQRAAYERSQYTTVVVPANTVMADGRMELSLELEEGLVKGIELVSMEGENAVIKIKDDSDYSLELKDGKVCAISGADIVDKCKGENAENIAHTVSRSAVKR